MTLRPLTVLRLAIADLFGEYILMLCTAIGLSAVLAPLVVLGGLRAGVIEELRRSLLQDPHAREIATASNRNFPAADLQTLRQNPGVAFVAPKIRSMAATFFVEPAGHRERAIFLELLPSGKGDPLIPVAPERPEQIVLSAAAAARLTVGPGDTLVGHLSQVAGGAEKVRLVPLTVLDVAPPSAFPNRQAAFVTIPFAALAQAVHDGDIPAPESLSELPETIPEHFAGFRLYTNDLEGVPAMDAFLRRSEHIDLDSRAGDVAGLMRIDHDLGLLYFLIAGLGGAGFLVSLGAGLWANVERKRTSLALLRFIGLGTDSLRLFPMVQATLVSILGSAMALSGAVATAWLINTQFAGVLALQHPLCVISYEFAGFAAGVTCVGAVLVAAAAGTRAASVEAWAGVTEA